MKAKVFVFLFSFLFLFTSISNIFAAEIIGDYEVKYGTDVSLDDIKSKDNSSGGYFSKFKYYYILYTHEAIYCYHFNDLNLLRYTVTDNNSLSPVFDASEENVLRRVVYDLGTYNIVSNVEFTSSIGLIELPRVGYSNENYYLLAHNFDIIYNDVLIAPSMEDDTIGDLNSRLQITYEYNEDNTECKINATIKDGAFTDKIFYSNDLPSITGQGLITKKAFPIDGITITDNQALFFQAEDKDGNIIATNSVSINGLGILSDDKFSVKFEFNNNKMDFTPSISMDQYAYYSIFFKLSNSDFIESSDFNNLSENNQVENNYTYRLISTSDKEVIFDIIFEIMNNKTGSICLTKSYKIRLSKYSIDSVGEGIIVGGIIGDKPSGVVGDNEIIGDIDWSFSNSVNNIKDFFNNAKEFFNLVLIFINDLPGWIVAPLYTLLFFAVILFVYHLLRG